ncbi:MAG: HDOD domain-containing protein [Sulfurimonas sp.]|jgi:HD-like signal output (HDOD) protein|nr:HDOD domain-containing protein [Sulfurimonas sp.]MBU1216316.1 HDOD domain-containing protein [bacterium]MBU1434622.1 HDOD domain-containing protein [bacterium]MBU1502200.1 HDOD domain-containing protein [bacterium]MBU3939698.1 HDOD domain-containing protein [bacterium]
MTKTLIANIDAIPALPESVQEVERLYQDENSTFEDMQKAIEKDPLLTANLLRIVNSPMYGVKSKVSTIKQAISLLGKDAVRTFVLSSSVNSFTIDLSPYGMTKEQFALACERQLALTVNWLIRRKPRRLRVLGPAAFLVDIGRIIIAKTLIEDAKTDLIKDALANGKDIAKAEKEACGAQTTDVTATLFHKWNLDADIIHTIRYSDDPEGTVEEEREMAAELKAVRETILPNGEITEASIATAKETIEEFGLDLEGYEKALEKVLNS